MAVDKQRPGRHANSYEARVQLEEAVDEAWGAMKAEDVARAAHHLNDVFCAIDHFKGGNNLCTGGLPSSLSQTITERLYMYFHKYRGYDSVKSQISKKHN